MTYAKQCIGALQAAGLEVYVVDHDSSWPPALLWLAELDDTPGVTVLRRGENAYPWELWKWEPFREVLWGDTEPYLVTDPDVIPSDDCPGDWVTRLADVLARSGCVKAGLGLRLDRLPGSRREQADYESVFWKDEWEPGVFRANVDTTLALYRPYTEYPLFALGPAVRTGFPYVADHLPWYEGDELSPELRHYYSRYDPGQNVVRILKD